MSADTWLNYLLTEGLLRFGLAMVGGMFVLYLYLRIRVVKEWELLESMPQDTEEDIRSIARQKSLIRRNIGIFRWFVVVGAVIAVHDFVLKAFGSSLVEIWGNALWAVSAVLMITVSVSALTDRFLCRSILRLSNPRWAIINHRVFVKRRLVMPL